MKSTSQKSGNTGFCIRCGTQINPFVQNAIQYEQDILIKQKKRIITMYMEKNQSSLLKNQFVILVLKKIV